MACNNVCKLCNRLIISTAVNYDAATNELIIALPNGCYPNGEKFCIVVAQNIPATTPISATVVVTIGTGVTRYPLVRRNCVQATACNIRTRTKYSTCVFTNTVSGVFRLLGDIGCCGTEILPSLPVDETAAATPTAEPVALRTAPTKTTKAKEVTNNA